MSRFGGDDKDLIEVIPVKELLHLLAIIDADTRHLKAIYMFVQQAKVLVQRDTVLEFPSVLKSHYREPTDCAQRLEELEDVDDGHM